jgi:hypothetical protein
MLTTELIWWYDSRYPPKDNAFLNGVFSPVKEELTARGLPVTGVLPPQLSKTFS